MSKLLSCFALLIFAGCASVPIVTSAITLDKNQVIAVQSSVKRMLKDPTSAQFGGMIAARDNDGIIHVCGTVNAKNSFGGYIGQSPYIGQFVNGIFVVAYISTAEQISLIVTKGECHKYGIDL